LARQEREIELATAWFEQLIAELRQHMAREIENEKVRVKFLDRESRRTRAFSGPEGQDPYGVATPRTMARIMEFRTSAPVKPLRIVPLTGLAKKCPVKPKLRPKTALLRGSFCITSLFISQSPRNHRRRDGPYASACRTAPLASRRQGEAPSE
jgi:hypothetical protein